MSIETDVYAALASHAPLAALVGDRIFPYALPEGTALPAVAFARTRTTPMNVLDGVAALTQYRFAAFAWSAGIAGSEEVADAVVGALAVAGVPYEDRAGTLDEESGLYGVAVEFEWWG
jgi:hypothetical protein